MSISRRGFLSSILAAGMAPSIIRVENAMKIIAPKQEILLPSKLPIIVHFNIDTVDSLMKVGSFNRSRETALGGYCSPVKLRTVIPDSVDKRILIQRG